MEKLAGFIQPKAPALAVHRLFPKINLSACRNCRGAGKRVINGVEWPCFNCAGSGTVTQ